MQCQPYKATLFNGLTSEELWQFNGIPTELWHYSICSELPPQDLLSISKTCKFFKLIALQQDLWKAICENYIPRVFSQTNPESQDFRLLWLTQARLFP